MPLCGIVQLMNSFLTTSLRDVHSPFLYEWTSEINAWKVCPQPQLLETLSNPSWARLLPGEVTERSVTHIILVASSAVLSPSTSQGEREEGECGRGCERGRATLCLELASRNPTPTR